MVMNKEEILHFIEVYQSKDIIWNPRNPNHYNKLRREDAWEEIAKEMGKPVNFLKKKMENLLSALRRERMKIKNNKRANEVYTSQWFAYESFKFILDRNKSKSSLGANKPAPNSHEGDTSTDGNERLLPAGNDSTPIPIGKRKRSVTEEEYLEKAFEILSATSNKDDESGHFGNFVASKLRLYDNDVRSMVQKEILNVFVKANKGYYSAHYDAQEYPTYLQTGPASNVSSHSLENMERTES